MNIHQIQQQGTGISLGPVTVKKLFPKKPGDKSLFLLISDSTGEAALKIWGPASNSPLQDGQQITVTGSGPKGGLAHKEYNGKWTINANDCSVAIAGGSTMSGVEAAPAYAAPAYAAPAPVAYAAPAAAAPAVDKLPDVMKRCAMATTLYIDELVVNHGFSKEEALMLAQNAPAWYPLMWFGEKGIH
jgi:hypothetical protein